MIVTEEKAKTMQCQEGVRQQPLAADWQYATPRCIGSACMAWRWFDNTEDHAIKEPRGFCGKAGKP